MDLIVIAWIVLNAIALLIIFGVFLAFNRETFSWSAAGGRARAAVWLLPIAGVLGGVAYETVPVFLSDVTAPSPDYEPSHGMLHDSETVEVSAALPIEAAAEAPGLPKWTAEPLRLTSDGVMILPVHSGWHASPEEARSDARARALSVVTADFQAAYPGARGRWSPDSIDQAGVVEQTALREKQVDFGPMTGPMYQAHLQLKLTDESRSTLLSRWTEALSVFRFLILFCWCVLLTVVFAAGAAYLRFDHRTEGRYRFWLKVAAVAVIISAGLASHGFLEYAALIQRTKVV